MSEPSAELREQCRAFLNGWNENVVSYKPLSYFVQAQIDRAVVEMREALTEWIAYYHDGMYSENNPAVRTMIARSRRALAQKEQPK